MKTSFLTQIFQAILCDDENEHIYLAYTWVRVCMWILSLSLGVAPYLSVHNFITTMDI